MGRSNLCEAQAQEHDSIFDNLKTKQEEKKGRKQYNRTKELLNNLLYTEKTS